MENIKHVFLDLDHTLWDFEKNSRMAFAQIFQEQRIDLDFDTFMQVYIPINKGYWQRFSKQELTREALRFGRLKDTFDALGYQTLDSFIDTMADLYIAYLPNNNHLIEGAIALLEYLHSKYQLHMITNGFDKVQRQKIAASSIAPYFDTIVTSGSIGFKKPHPKVFEHALTLAGAKASESVMIGDNFEADIKGAHQVGITPIYFRNFQESVSSEFITVDALMQIKQYL